MRLAGFFALVSMLALHAGVVRAAEEAAKEPDEPKTRVAVFEKNAKVRDWQVMGALKALPDDHKLQVTFEQVWDMSPQKFVEIAKVLTPLNADGKPDGVESYFKEWKGLQRTISYKNGVKDGPEKVYEHADGRNEFVREETQWKEGKMAGKRIVYYPDGKVATEVTYEDGKPAGEGKSYDREGRLTQVIRYKDGKRDGEMTDYWPATGKPKRVVPCTAGVVNGLVKEYYEDGTLERELPFKNDALHGIEKHHDEKGNLTLTRYWLEGELVPEGVFKEKFKE